MSLPSFPDKDKTPTREEAINQIISSIAMEELGLSHIINAEGEKLQYALGTLTGTTGPVEELTIDDLMKLNGSIHETLNGTMMNQFFLKEKLAKVLSVQAEPTPIEPAPFLSSYMEALIDTQNVDAGANIVFDIDSVDDVGNNITLDTSGTIFTINRTGLYHIEWNVNLLSDSDAVIGLLENGEAASGASSTIPGNLSSGTVINVDTVPFTLSLHNYYLPIEISRPNGWIDSAGSIRIIRFADGPSV